MNTGVSPSRQLCESSQEEVHLHGCNFGRTDDPDWTFLLHLNLPLRKENDQQCRRNPQRLGHQGTEQRKRHQFVRTHSDLVHWVLLCLSGRLFRQLLQRWCRARDHSHSETFRLCAGASCAGLHHSAAKKALDVF